MSAMVEVQVADLVGPALDWAVATAEGWRIEIVGKSISNVDKHGGHVAWLEPSSCWSQGGPLLDSYCRGFGMMDDGRDGTWRALGYSCGKSLDLARTVRLASGPTILIAACRAIVAAKLGDVVQVPAKLVEEPHA